ncbi:hypothetical protein E2493_15095 [Sphingomonas parva]|uniref:Uncharacterized protein n=1 Tax=Sphingomonas parva TaxID=2555898 RepID=A0A4Y8ZN69_9SPHN|nr:DUF6157 family protein [Sphingomonas parva]TFI57404.1 hypothetical protein E2493_15095 [Sphingomonas parva]
MTTNYLDTFIAVSPDCPSTSGVLPREGTVAALQLDLLRARPYALTSDDLLFEVHVRRSGGEAMERAAFFARAQACLRASPLVKQHGWGLHHDGEGRVAAYPVDSDDYARLLADPSLKQVRGMRSRRA